MCTEMTDTHDNKIRLWQLLYICKAKKTHLNDKFVIGGLCVCRQTTKIGALNLLCLKCN